MIQDAEDLKHEADMDELHRKIAAEPVPPNSKAAAEAIASSPVDKSDPLKSEANNAAAIPRSDDVHEGGGDDGIVTEDYNYLKVSRL